jgi:hypothetical protein
MPHTYTYTPCPRHTLPSPLSTDKCIIYTYHTIAYTITCTHVCFHHTYMHTHMHVHTILYHTVDTYTKCTKYTTPPPHTLLPSHTVDTHTKQTQDFPMHSLNISHYTHTHTHTRELVTNYFANLISNTLPFSCSSDPPSSLSYLEHIKHTL